jgi:kinesin family protein 18/19
VNQVRIGKLSLIDLAGSERASRAGNAGVRLQEGACINKSLLALSNCINSLHSNSMKGETNFVPFRDSKLTRLLKDSLGGNCKTVMIANVSSCHIHLEDTHNTLKYANRTKELKTFLSKNVQDNPYHELEESKVELLESQISILKAKVGTLED